MSDTKDIFRFHGSVYEYAGDGFKKLINSATATATDGANAGVNVSVDETGKANFEFTLPKGKTGDTGPQGEGFKI